jgi:hypothetical protein
MNVLLHQLLLGKVAAIIEGHRMPFPVSLKDITCHPCFTSQGHVM